MNHLIHSAHSRTKTRLLVAATAVGVALALAACSGASTNPAKTSTSADSSTIVAQAKKEIAPVIAPQTKLPSEALGAFTPKSSATIYVVSCDPQFEGCSKASAAMKEAAAAIGYTFKVCATSVTNPDSTSQCFTNAINAKPDVIIPIAIGENESGGGYAAAKTAGIPIIGMVAANKPGTTATEYAGQGWNINLGKLVAYWDIAKTNGGSKALVPVITSNNSINERYEGMKEVFAKCAECDLKLINIAGSASAEDITKQITAAMQANPTYTILNANVNFLATVALDAVRQSGRTDMVVTGADGASVNLASMRKGQLAFDAGLPNVSDGWATIDLAARVISGKKVPKEFNDLTIGLTPANIDKIDYAGPVGFRDVFKKLWGK
jgi:ribose transport system substrate-binding protein